MTPFIALAGVAATIKLWACIGADDPSSSAAGWVTRVRTPCMADQLSNNPLWHSVSVAISGTAHSNAYRETADR
jgi:hypothetical protein